MFPIIQIVQMYMKIYKCMINSKEIPELQCMSIHRTEIVEIIEMVIVIVYSYKIIPEIGVIARFWP